jgi:hypothetical protein
MKLHLPSPSSDGDGKLPQTPRRDVMPRSRYGLSLAELVLVEAGWRVVWLGEGPPLAELNPLIPKLKPDLLVVSASTWSSQSVIARYQAELMRVAARRRIPVVLGGVGLWAAARGLIGLSPLENCTLSWFACNGEPGQSRSVLWRINGEALLRKNGPRSWKT